MVKQKKWLSLNGFFPFQVSLLVGSLREYLLVFWTRYLYTWIFFLTRLLICMFIMCSTLLNNLSSSFFLFWVNNSFYRQYHMVISQCLMVLEGVFGFCSRVVLEYGPCLLWTISSIMAEENSKKSIIWHTVTKLWWVVRGSGF